MRKIGDMARKGVGRGRISRHGSWRNSRANRHHTRGISKDDFTKMSASDPAPDNEEEDIEKAVPENKLTSDSLAEGF